jgi:hypothetical protein
MLISAVSALISVSNNFTDGPQSQTGSTWTFTNANVGVNVIGTLLSTNANVGILNCSNANVTNETIGRSNISTANVTVANVVAATITDLNATRITTANANVTLLLQVDDRANIFSANIQSANITTLGVSFLSASELTLAVLNASFANITTLSVTGTSQHQALVATLVTTDNCNVRILNASTANISNLTAPTVNASFANLTTASIGTLTITTTAVGTVTTGILNASFANITSANIVAANIGQANITQMTGTTITTLNVSSLNVTAITSAPTMAGNPTANLHIATKNYADTGAGGNVVWKNTFSAKGDLPVGNGVNTFTNIQSGVNGQSLIVDTQTSSGLRWSNTAPSQSFRGLSLQTSVTDFKNSNANNIILEHVDEITMDDGELVRGWTDKSVIINTANSGVGGLDTGTMLANTWYEIYAIRKRSDGTKGFIIHRALDRYVDQNTAGVAQFAHNATVQVNRVTAPNVRVAQSFVANVSGPLTSFEMRMFKTGTPTGNVWIQLHANTAGDPGASALAISRKYDVARMVITTHYPIRFVFDVTANVVATTSYFAVAQTDFTASDTNHITLEASSTDYFNGVVKGNTGASWVDLSPGIGTLIFKEYVEANSTSLTFPAGYDQKCLVGYTATDQAGKLREFTQRDRKIMCPLTAQWMGFASIGTEKEVSDLTTVLPPTTAEVMFMIVGGTASPQAMSLGRLHAIDLTAVTIADTLGGIVWCQASGGTTISPTPPIWVEHQALNMRVQTAAGKLYPVSITF